jgi:hypothetical protein
MWNFIKNSIMRCAVSNKKKYLFVAFVASCIHVFASESANASIVTVECGDFSGKRLHFFQDGRQEGIANLV